jgi:hypothetical protein
MPPIRQRRPLLEGIMEEKEMEKAAAPIWPGDLGPLIRWFQGTPLRELPQGVFVLRENRTVNSANFYPYVREAISRGPDRNPVHFDAFEMDLAALKAYVENQKRLKEEAAKQAK